MFDEVCTLFTGVLLIELQRECSNTVRDFTFQEVLLAKPLNVISWPFIARNLLIVLRQSFKPVEAVHVFNAPATEKEVTQIPLLGPLLRCHIHFPHIRPCCLHAMEEELLSTSSTHVSIIVFDG